MAGRMTVSNMTIEAGARAGMIAPDETTFEYVKGRPYAPKGDGGGQIKTGFRAACRRAGIERFSTHDCRHTWASWHYAENRDLLALQALGGWKSIQMVTRYAHLNAAHLAPGVHAMPAMAGRRMG